MALYHSPRIVMQGLVLCLDAGNVKSYPGSGTTWTDLSGSGNNATVNGNVYDNGTFTLTTNSNNTLSGANFNITGGSFSMEAIIYPFGDSLTGTTGQILTQDAGSGNGNGWQWRINNSTDRMEFIYWTSSSRSSAVTISSNTALVYNNWYQLVVTYDGLTIKMYQNTLETHSSTPTSSLYESNFNIGIGMFNRTLSFSDILNGKIAIIRLYDNKALTPQEIQQNYNALKGRFQ